ncbi:MAG: 50S ribosomal protein L10 [Candidatus Scalinduaceae bacterium]
MSKELKKLVVDELISDYRGVNNFIVVSFKGVNTQQANTLRRDLSEKDIKLKVVKNSLAAIAFKEIGIPALGQMLEGPSAITISDNDPVILAKVLAKWSREISGLKIMGGLMDGEMLPLEDIKALSAIPSKQVVLTQILFGISTPLIQLANLFNAVTNNLYFVLLAIKEKKSNGDKKNV